MPLLKRTYTLPPDTVQAFEDAVDAGKRSAVVAALLQDWLEHRRREELRQAVIEGCHDMANVYLDIEQEFHPWTRDASPAGTAP